MNLRSSAFYLKKTPTTPRLQVLSVPTEIALLTTGWAPWRSRRFSGGEAQQYSKLLIKMQPFGITCSNLWWELLLTPNKLLPYANGVESSAFSPNHRFPLYLLYMVPWSFSVLDIWLLCPVIRLLPVAPWLRVTLCEISTSAARASVCLPHYSWTPSSLWPQMLHRTLAHLPKDEVPVTSTGHNRSSTGFPHHYSKLYYLKTFLIGTFLTHSQWVTVIWYLLYTRNSTKNKSWRNWSEEE